MSASPKGFDVTFLNMTTDQEFLPAFRNLAYTDTPTLNRLNSRGRINTTGKSMGSVSMTGSGLRWVAGLKKHSPTGLTGGYEPMASQPATPTVAAALDAAKYYATVAISGDEERMNTGGKTKLLDMLKIQMDSAYSGIKDDMNTDLFGSSTTRGGFNTIVGLAAILGTSRTYAGIASTPTNANANWESNVSATAHTTANLKDPASTSYMPLVLANSFVSCYNPPDLIVMTTAEFVLYSTIMQIQNLTFNNTKGDIGFNSIDLLGSEVIYDKSATAYSLYMLRTKSLTLYAYPSANFEMDQGGWRISEDQDAKKAHIIWMGQLVCEAPKDNSILTSVGAT
jgi:hypothetical protein